MQPLLSSSGFRDGLGERYLVFDRESGNICERLLLRSELAAYETAIRRRVGRLVSIQAPEIVPVVSVERDPATRRLAVVSKHASGVRLHEMLRGARDREIVPDMGASLYVAAEVLQATHAFHSLTGLPHGMLNPHHIIVSPAGDLQITDYAFAEVIEAANFSRERLWRELHIAAWMGSDVFSFQADVRHGALIAMALMVGRPLESEDLTAAIDSLLAEVEEAAMIRGGRLFADPVGAWLVRALGAGSSEGYADAGAAADACAALLTDRERNEAARALPQLLEAITEPLPEVVIASRPPEAVPSTYETELTETDIAAAPVADVAPEAESTFAAWPSSAIVGSEPRPSATEAHAQEEFPETASFDEVVAPADWTTLDREPPSEIVEPVLDERHEEIAFPASEPVPVEEPVEEPAIEASEPGNEPAAVSEEPERRGKKRKKRRGKRGGATETPAAPPPPSAPIAPPVISIAHPPEPIPHTPWVPATASAPRAEESREIGSASPFSILERPAATPPAAPAPQPQVDRGPSQYFPPDVIDTNISQPQRPPTPPPQVQAQAPAPAPAVPGIEAPQVIRLKSAVSQPETPAPIRLKSQVEEPTAIRFKEQPAAAKPRTVAPAESYEPRPEPDEAERKIPRHLWKYVAAAVVVLIAGVAAVTMKFTIGARDVPPGTLVIETTPAGSQIFVDGDVKGLTPATLNLTPGRHEVKLTRKGASHSWNVEVTSGARRVERLDWSALFSTGGVEIVSNNPGAKVLVDGKPRGVVPVTITDLPPGRHLVLVQSPSGNVRRTVTIVAGETTRLDLAIYSGWLVVGSPIELDVAENGKVIGQAGQGPLVLPAGRHRIDLVNQMYGYRSSHEVEIRPGEEERLVENPSGVLNVNATPWAEVWVDGTRAGETPLANVKVPLGTREVLFKHPQFGERRVTVTVTAKEAVQLAIDMTKPQ